MASRSRTLKRRTFLKCLVGGGVGLARTARGAAAAISKPLAGQTVKVVMWRTAYWEAINSYLAEFTDLTGAKVEMDMLAFAVHNQRVDLDLAGATGAFDVCNNAFAMSGKWIGANWCTDLMPLINDSQMTDKAKLGVEDFVGGAISTFRRGDKLYGLPWTMDTFQLAYRKDIFQKYGISTPPSTFEEMITVAKKIHTPEIVANLERGTNGLQAIWPQYLFAYGGAFYAKPPEDMTPVLNSPEALRATEVFVTLARDYGTPASVSLTDAETTTMFNQGKAAMYIDGLSLLSSSLDAKKSAVYDKISFAPVPAGPKGAKPSVGAHAAMIPAATKDKRKGWEFIKWAVSKEMMARVALDKDYVAVSRKSILDDPKYKKKYTWGGADIGKLQSDAARLAGEGYMFYRTMPEFPAVGDRVVIALSEIMTNQKQTKPALDTLNVEVARILENAGYKIRKP